MARLIFFTKVQSLTEQDEDTDELSNDSDAN
jgi:hypothetical protein